MFLFLTYYHVQPIIDTPEPATWMLFAAGAGVLAVYKGLRYFRK